MIVSGSSGLDIDALVGGLVAAARTPISLLTSRKAQLDSATQTLGAISTRLSSLKTATSALSTRSGFASSTITASSGALTGQVTGQTTPGTYAVTVTQLAQAQRTRSDVRASATDAMNESGTLDLQVGGATPVQITVEPTDSLSAVATKINQSGARIKASVLDTGSGYRLVVGGMDTGAASSFVLNQQGFDLGLETAENQVQVAQDAQLTVDGTSITRGSNQVRDAIAGVTLTLTEATVATSVTVAPDSSALREKLDAFVTAYNGLVSDAHAATGFGSVAATNRTLAGDRVVRSALGAVRRAAGDPVTGLVGTVRSLADVGLEFDNDGKLSLDASKLDAALAADAGAVEKLFVSDPTAGTVSAMDRVVAAIEVHATGTDARIKAHSATLQSRSSRLDAERSKMEQRLLAYEAQLRKQFIAMELVVTKYQLAGQSLPTTTVGFEG
jgi:flagellar hook-associated protein 2